MTVDDWWLISDADVDNDDTNADDTADADAYDTADAADEQMSLWAWADEQWHQELHTLECIIVPWTVIFMILRNKNPSKLQQFKALDNVDSACCFIEEKLEIFNITRGHSVVLDWDGKERGNQRPRQIGASLKRLCSRAMELGSGPEDSEKIWKILVHL